MSKTIMSKNKFINQWLRCFATDIDKKELQRCFADKFVWHIFSYKLLDSETFLVGDAARLAYDQADKSSCLFCDMYGKSGVTDILSDEYSSSSKIDSEIRELYVVSKDYSWTYIKTHENDNCGPYFYRRIQS